MQRISTRFGHPFMALLLAGLLAPHWASADQPGSTSPSPFETRQGIVELAEAAPFTGSEYRLSAGDSIAVNVFGEPDLTISSIRLDDAGTFSYPFLGEVRAAGRTTGQVEAAIIAGLKDGYLLDPKVSVTIVAYREFFISGEVRSPGSYPYQPGLTVRKAVSIAGGFTERASKGKIYLIPERTGGDNKPRRVDLESSVGPGSSITVEQRFF